MSWLTNLEAVIQKDEQWVVAEIRKGWTLVQNAEETAAVDVTNLFHWITAHQTQLQTLAQNALTDIQTAATVAAGVLPQYAMPIAASAAVMNTAIQAGAVAINSLAQGIQQGSTPMSTIANAYTATKTAANAVNNFLKTATSQQASQPAPAS